MMVLASVYLSVSSSLPGTPSIKPVESWLFVNLAYPFLVIMANTFLQVNLGIRPCLGYIKLYVSRYQKMRVILKLIFVKNTMA